MYIGSLKLDQFRNYESLELTFSKGTNLFYGNNAQGKTNILEAVYFCGTTRSHRTAKDREMIRFGSDDAHIRMEMTKRNVDFRIDMHLKHAGTKGIAINAVPIRRAAELIGLGHFVFFSPEDLRIIKNGPTERRRFLDMELCQLDSVYVSCLSQYQKVVNQRNHLLRDLGNRSQDIDTLDVWDEQLINYGSMIIDTRNRFIDQLSEIIRPIHRKLSGSLEEISVVYEKNVSSEEFRDTLAKNRERELYQRSTETGPHRDDLKIMLNDIDIRHFGSQGQQRSAALSLKLAEIELVRQTTGDAPVLLLDDVLSELDRNRRAYLLESIGEIQTFITCTGPEEYKENDIKIDQLFHVENGSCSPYLSASADLHEMQ